MVNGEDADSSDSEDNLELSDEEETYESSEDEEENEDSDEDNENEAEDESDNESDNDSSHESSQNDDEEDSNSESGEYVLSDNEKENGVNEKKDTVNESDSVSNKNEKSDCSDEYRGYDTSDEEDIRNTVGNIPMNWYDEYKHLGYDWDGNKIIKPPAADQLDAFLQRVDDPDFWRTVKDPKTGQDVILSEEDIQTIRRIQGHKIPDAAFEEYAVSRNINSSINLSMQFIFNCSRG